MNINELLPLNVRSIKKGIGSFIIFNFNLDYKLWIYLSDWKIIDLTISKTLLNSSIVNEYNCIEIFKHLSFCSLKSFTVENCKFKFNFDDKYLLVLSKNLDEYEVDDELFMFFLQNEHRVISYSPQKGLFEEKE